MANIEYKSAEEQNRRTDFNPYKASMEEIENDWKMLDETHARFLSDLYDIILSENSFNVDLTEEHLNKIMYASFSSSPFDKSIINNPKIKAVDGVKLTDFKYEETFRECLNVYYYLLWYEDAMKTDNDALVNKILDLIVKSPVPENMLLDELIGDYYNGKYANYSNYDIVYQLIRDYTVAEIKIIIHDIEQNCYRRAEYVAQCNNFDVKKCPNCGYENTASISKCFRCGKKL